MSLTEIDEIERYYFHKGQRLALAVQAHTEYIIAPRRWGKSDGVIAPRLIRNVHALPGLGGAIVSSTYKQAKTRTLPATFAALRRMGYIKDVHYVIGKPPPKELGFKKPYVEPFNYDDVISWWNGHLTYIISQDVTGSSNSYTFYYVIGDEAKFLNYDKLKEETLPANGGSQAYIPKDCPWVHGITFTTDQPLLKSGQWIYEKESQCDTEAIELIVHYATELGKLERSLLKKETTHYLRLKRDLELKLYVLRKKATWFHEANPFDNIDVVGEDYFYNMKRDLPPITFQTAIMNRRIRKIANGFYSALNEDRHVYEAPPSSTVIGLGYADKPVKGGCELDGDLMHDKALHIAFDYNSSINNVVTCQEDKGVMRVLNWQFVKTPRKLKELCNEWCDYYESFAKKEVVYYYDSTAIPESAATDYTFRDIVIDTLTARGWRVHGVDIGRPMFHNLKHQYIDLALKGIKYTFPLFNKQNCELLIAAMESTGVRIGKNGFEKDKRDEAKPDTADNPDELKTHGPDAFDTAFIGINFYYFDPEYSYIGTPGFRS